MKERQRKIEKHTKKKKSTSKTERDEWMRQKEHVRRGENEQS